MDTGEIDLKSLGASRTIWLTTIGRRTGLPRRVEIWWWNIDGRFFITGTTGRRDWLANVLADPHVVIGVDGQTLEAIARPVVDSQLRQRLFTDPAASWYSSQQPLSELVAYAPMVEIELSQRARRRGEANS